MTSKIDSNLPLKGKCLAITGGTGSFGRAMLRRVLSSDLDEIRIVSRDEDKQERLRHEFSDSRIKCVIADVRDRESMSLALKKVDLVFHAAALKQVPTGEFFPAEVLKTNTLGSENVLRSSIENGVRKVVLLSTDKAVEPVNAMGMTKALMEKMGLALARMKNIDTDIVITRYGNVLCSRGSVIPKFVDQVNEGRPLTLTDGSMTRFLMSLDEAIDLVLYALQKGSSGDTFVKQSPAATVQKLATAVASIMGKPDYDIVELGVRHGEKIHETLLSSREFSTAEIKDGYFHISITGQGVNFSEFDVAGGKSIEKHEGYTSSNTKQLEVSEIIEILQNNYEFKLISGKI